MAASVPDQFDEPGPPTHEARARVLRLLRDQLLTPAAS